MSIRASGRIISINLLTFLYECRLLTVALHTIYSVAHSDGVLTKENSCECQIEFSIIALKALSSQRKVAQ